MHVVSEQRGEGPLPRAVRGMGRGGGRNHIHVHQCAAWWRKGLVAGIYFYLINSQLHKIHRLPDK